jgi:hypothetical protein
LENQDVNLGRLGETLKAAIDLNGRYYGALLQLSTEYLRSLGNMLTEVVEQSPSVSAGNSPPASQGMTPPMLLAAHAGEEARGAFMIENTLRQAVTARVVVSGAGAAGRAVVEPESVGLKPGEECVVQIAVAIDDRVVPGRDEPGEIAIPQLASRTVPFVVRRLADSDQPSNRSQTPAPAGRRRSAGRQRAGS